MELELAVSEPQPPPEEEIWQPADNTIYVFEEDEIVKEIFCETREAYQLIIKNAHLAVILHNRDHETVWRVVAGVCTW